VSSDDRYKAEILHRSWQQSVYGINFGPIAGTRMSGRHLRSFRSGSRSEYLALFGLSRFSFVQQIPRQEDFGVDFLCTLAAESKGNEEDLYPLVFPENSFCVQVKSNTDYFDLDRHFLHWMSYHIQLPLFICVIDKKNGGRFSLYATSVIWKVLFLRPKPKKIQIKFGDAPTGTSNPKLIQDEGEEEAEFTVWLGKPIINLSMDELELSGNLAYAAIKPWILTDIANIENKRSGAIVTKHIMQWETNKEPLPGHYSIYYDGPNYQAAEKFILPTLVSLLHNYRKQNSKEPSILLENKINTLISYANSMGVDIEKHLPPEQTPNNEPVIGSVGTIVSTGGTGASAPT
jgi:hypothetical protein